MAEMITDCAKYAQICAIGAESAECTPSCLAGIETAQSVLNTFKFEFYTFLKGSKERVGTTITCLQNVRKVEKSE